MKLSLTPPYGFVDPYTPAPVRNARPGRSARNPLISRVILFAVLGAIALAALVYFRGSEVAAGSAAEDAGVAYAEAAYAGATHERPACPAGLTGEELPSLTGPVAVTGRGSDVTDGSGTVRIGVNPTADTTNYVEIVLPVVLTPGAPADQSASWKVCGPA